jgi:hypothetical protein
VVENSVAGSQVTAYSYPEAQSNICAVKLILSLNAPANPSFHRTCGIAVQAGEFKRCERVGMMSVEVG